MEEVSKLRANRQITEALRQRNGPRTNELHDLPTNSEVLVWRESGEWAGPFKLLSMEGETCKVLLPSGPTNFRSTSVKPYLKEQRQESQQKERQQEPQEEESTENALVIPNPSTVEIVPNLTRKNPIRERQIPSRFRQNLADLTIAYVPELDKVESFISGRFEWTTLDKKPDFTKSRQKELDGLLQKGVFQVIPAPEIPKGIRLFGSRFVDKIKN